MKSEVYYFAAAKLCDMKKNSNPGNSNGAVLSEKDFI